MTEPGNIVGGLPQGVGASAAQTGLSRSASSQQAVSPVPASIPSAFASFTVMGEVVVPRAIANAADALANEPHFFRAMALGRWLLPDCGGHQRQEATNRLMQRWRKMGLAEYGSRGWSLSKGAWDTLQAQAIEARRAATGTGAVHESAVGETDAPAKPDHILTEQKEAG